MDDDISRSFCRLCLILTHADRTTDLDSNTQLREVLLKVFPGMKHLVQSPKICFECIDQLNFALDFKQKVASNEAKVKLDPYLTLGAVENICRLCLVETETDNDFVLMYENNSYSYKLIRTMAEISTVVMNFNIFEKPKMCIHCWSSVKEIYAFKKSCFNNEEKLQTFWKSNYDDKFTLMPEEQVFTMLLGEESIKLRHSTVSKVHEKEDSSDDDCYIVETTDDVTVNETVHKTLKESNESLKTDTKETTSELATENIILACKSKVESHKKEVLAMEEEPKKGNGQRKVERLNKNEETVKRKVGRPRKHKKIDNGIHEIPKKKTKRYLVADGVKTDASTTETATMKTTSHHKIEHAVPSCKSHCDRELKIVLDGKHLVGEEILKNEVEDSLAKKGEVKSSFENSNGKRKVGGPSKNEQTVKRKVGRPIKNEQTVKRKVGRPIKNEQTVKRKVGRPRKHIETDNENRAIKRKIVGSLKEKEQKFTIQNGKFFCTFCPFKSASQLYLLKHFNLYHIRDSPRKVYECVPCHFKTYFHHSFLRHHLGERHSHMIAKQLANEQEKNCSLQNKKLKNSSENKRNSRLQASNPEKARFKCDTCDFSVDCKNLLINHIKTEHNKPVVKCGDCDYVTSERNNIMSHMEKHIRFSEIGNKCQKCQFENQDPDVLEQHMQNCNGVVEDNSVKLLSPPSPPSPVDVKSVLKKRKVIKPGKLGNKLPNQKRAKKVVKEDKAKRFRQKYPPPVELDEPIKCDVCNTTYKNNVAFALHTIRHSEDTRYSCHVCPYKSRSKYEVEMHVRAHEGTSRYKCEVCDKTFKVRRHAIDHKYFHTGEKPFQCEICRKHFMFSRLLYFHRRSQHYEIITGSPRVKLYCKICCKHYACASGLRYHELTRHSDTGVDLSVLCDICGKRLSTKDKLKLHHRIHTGYKPFGCQICTKAFSTKKYLIEHVRVHTGEKPYICKYCGKGFTQRTPLTIHERTHTGEKPYICICCGKGFIGKVFLDSHMKSCSGKANI